jgi:hypothetical protein
MVFVLLSKMYKALAKISFTTALLILGACSSTQHISNLDLKESVGKLVLLNGYAANLKEGAILQLHNGGWVWIDSLQRWPCGYFTSKKSQHLQVTGILQERYDRMVFVRNESDTVFMQGITVTPDRDLKAASHRYVLTNCKWKRIR